MGGADPGRPIHACQRFWVALQNQHDDQDEQHCKLVVGSLTAAAITHVQLI